MGKEPYNGLLSTFTIRCNSWFYNISGITLSSPSKYKCQKKGFLNAFAIGILVFLIIDVFSHAWESTEEAASNALAGKTSFVDASLALLPLFGGLGIGLLGLTWYENKFMNRQGLLLKGIFGKPKEDGYKEVSDNRKNPQQQQPMLLQQTTAYKLAIMIAVGIGTHNFSEGLAIGQSYISGAIPLHYY